MFDFWRSEIELLDLFFNVRTHICESATHLRPATIAVHQLKGFLARTRCERYEGDLRGAVGGNGGLCLHGANRIECGSDLSGKDRSLLLDGKDTRKFVGFTPPK